MRWAKKIGPWGGGLSSPRLVDKTVYPLKVSWKPCPSIPGVDTWTEETPYGASVRFSGKAGYGNVDRSLCPGAWKCVDLRNRISGNAHGSHCLISTYTMWFLLSDE
jgi:hypothetical protein